MTLLRLFAPVAILLWLPTASLAEIFTIETGGDTFVSGATVATTIGTEGDAFVAARSAAPRGTTSGDLHVAGFDVSVTADAAGDLYAIGTNVIVRGNVGKDLTVLGFSVRTEDTSEIAGNARLFGNSVTIEAPVAGALIATGMDVILNAPISGDVRVMADDITFGPDAVIRGTLTYLSDDPIEVPERVATAARVNFERVDPVDFWKDIDEFRRDMPILPTFVSVLSGFLVSLFFFFVLGAICLGLVPNRTEALRSRVAGAPGRAVLLGVIGLSMLFGMVPITALTIFGLPFVPIALLAIVVAWVFGYALGAYTVAMKIWSGLGGDEDVGNLGRLLVFAAAITIIALLNFIPFVGWIANYLLVLLGIGGLTHAIFSYFVDDPDGSLDIDMKPVET